MTVSVRAARPSPFAFFEREAEPATAAQLCGREVVAGDAAALLTPPSGAVVAAILQFHDRAEEREDGLTLIRLSAERLADPDIAALLGTEAERAARVSVLWNEREQELVRVLETPAQPEPTFSASRYARARMKSGRPALVAVEAA